MARLRLEAIDVLLVDPDFELRNLLREVLRQQGFRNPRAVASLATMQDAMKETIPDLLIADTVLSDGDFSAFLIELRHGRTEFHPFLPVIAMTREPTPQQVERIIDAGADLLLTKPVSAKQLLGRVERLIRARKPFVVIEDYVGPDRGRDVVTQGSQVLDVPNPLKDKAIDGKSADQIQREIDAAVARVNVAKLKHRAIELETEAGGVAAACGKRESEQERAAFAAHLERLRFLTEDMSRRVLGTEYEHISELCQTLSMVTGDLLAQIDDPPKRDLDLLLPLAMAIVAAFTAGAGAIAVAREISAAVGGERSGRSVSGG